MQELELHPAVGGGRVEVKLNLGGGPVHAKALDAGGGGQAAAERETASEHVASKDCVLVCFCTQYNASVACRYSKT